MEEKTELVEKHYAKDVKELLNIDKFKSDAKKEINQFKKFALKGITELAMAVLIASEFQKFINTIIESVIMPILNQWFKADSWREATWQINQHISIEIGKLLDSGLKLFVISLIAYVIWFKIIKPLRAKEEEED